MLNENQAATIWACAAGSHENRLKFPEVVAKLAGIGVERYFADYARNEIAYYLLDGQSLVVPVPPIAEPIAAEFSAEKVENAIRKSQRGEINYREFLDLTRRGGCVGYFVQIAGRKALYFGRNGEIHLEPFPAAANR